MCLFLSRGEDGGQDTSAVETAEVDYRAEAEDKLRALLNSVSRVSGARVIITFSDGVRYEYGEGGYSRSSPPVVEEKPPRVGGVAIVCEGGDNPAVQKKGDRSCMRAVRHPVVAGQRQRIERHKRWLSAAYV